MSIEDNLKQKIGPLPMWGWVAIAAGLITAWRLYESHKASTSSTADTTGSDTTGSDTTSSDQVPQWINQTFVSPQFAAPPAATGSTTGTATGTATGGTTTATATATKKPPPMPTGVTVTATTSTTASLKWSASSGATSYIVRATYQGKLMASTIASGTSATLSGLRPDSTITAHVAATGPGGTSSETNGPVFHTSK